MLNHPLSNSKFKGQLLKLKAPDCFLGVLCCIIVMVHHFPLIGEDMAGILSHRR